MESIIYYIILKNVYILLDCPQSSYKNLQLSNNTWKLFPLPRSPKFLIFDSLMGKKWHIIVVLMNIF